MQDGDTASVRTSVTLLRIAAGQWELTELPAVLEELGEQSRSFLVIQILEIAPFNDSRRRLLSELILRLAALNDEQTAHVRMLEVLKRHMDGIPSLLSDPNGRAQLALPLSPGEDAKNNGPRQGS
ncbi:hypothetical protein EAS56_09875 [Bradyrhizobium guangzhouense]|uniref:Transcriptional regulator n=2 Tax=Bradyrhizobium guangzhouense TaxID=1325095 RepID=A0ABY0E9X0_9BRAD|nr:hypothetical protein EAS56_09875 [Bradyrhizobium guangzhouense]